MRIRRLLLLMMLTVSIGASAIGNGKQNFNGGWLLRVGDFTGAEAPAFNDDGWQKVSLPHAFNEAEAFRVSIENLSDTVMWYRKHFSVDGTAGHKFFIEFEGVRFGADFWLNGHKLGLSENGVMACGFDMTPYIKDGENVIAVRVDNSWTYRERATGQRYQWNDKNFNANYGGIPKNVFLHVTGLVYQTLPLYSSLGTTGVYIYGSDYDIAGHAVTVNAESQVRNDGTSAVSLKYYCKVTDADGRQVASAEGTGSTLVPGAETVMKAALRLQNAHFWSWGYGYLYTVETGLKDAGGNIVDKTVTRTGFRKTAFTGGKVWLNGRCLMVHGYAQRTSNEWPGVGMSVPAWLSDYSNGLMVESGGNVVRWMHVTPWKQDIESCDRVGLIEAMPAGDAEKDVDGRRWEQRVELMRDAIIYNRNNPSILFYECGNKGISRSHMTEMKAVRDKYDPHGGRAIGSREMLDIDEAEYGGEMLYVNKSAERPLWSMEYNRDEGLRKYWDDESYPYHKEGDGPLYRGKPAFEYNHNQDSFAVSMVKRWYEYWQERPGTGRRVNSGGVKIVFSDTNTHHRGEANYRSSGVTDAMRIPKDAFFTHQVMWNGWVTPEKDATYIIGHWNYRPGTVKTVYVVSTGDDVELLVNGHKVGRGERSDEFLFTFPNMRYEAGKIEAVAYKDGKESSRYSLETAGEPHHLKMSVIGNPEGFKADGADMTMVEFEVVDSEGRRCPVDNRMVSFRMDGPAEWIGGIACPIDNSDHTRKAGKQPGMLDSSDSENTFDNFIRSMSLPVECGVNRVLLRSKPEAGDIMLTASAEGLQPVSIRLHTDSVDVAGYMPQMTLPCRLDRGETPQSPSFTDIRRSVEIAGVEAGSNGADAMKSIDDNETSEWKSDGNVKNAWITYKLKDKATVSELALKLAGWRSKYYPLAIYAGKKKVWQGWTYPTLGYAHITIDHPVKSDKLTIRMTGETRTKLEKGDTAELAGGKAGTMDFISSAKGKVELRIVEADLLVSEE